ncbi:DUF4352 domain-containing protein [Granulicoccus sp. GXG6511]|uniref:DUF4352 domain-containing protein n=1 Tax=Granulicoccus sp. GXG6511 TaxID=3381351 RepID=UPI003D7C9D26
MSQHNPDQFQPEGAAAYASPQPKDTDGPAPHRDPDEPTDPGKAAPTPVRARNVIAIVAFVVAVAGFVFAVWEGAYILGWVLLPIGFILALVALFQREQPKRMAVAALIIAVVGTVAGAIAFMSSAARAFDDAFSGGEVTAAPVAPVAPVAPDGGGAGDGEPAAEPAGGEQSAHGTRANPYPTGTALSNEEWQVTVNSVDLDANAKIAAENPFNDEPDAGYTFALVNLTVTYLGDESGTPAEVDVKYVTSAGNVISTYDKSVVGPDELGYAELYTGASATGNVALHIPKDDSGVLRVSPGMFGKDVFVALR